MLKAYYITLIAIFSHFAFDVFLNMTFSLFLRFVGGPLKKVTKIIDWNLYCILLGISPVQWVILSQIRSVLATIWWGNIRYENLRNVTSFLKCLLCKKYYYLFNQSTSLHNLMYYLLDQQENWDVYELNFSWDFPQNNIYNYSFTMVTLKGITYYFTSDLLFMQRGYTANLVKIGWIVLKSVSWPAGPLKTNWPTPPQGVYGVIYC